MNVRSLAMFPAILVFLAGCQAPDPSTDPLAIHLTTSEKSANHFKRIPAFDLPGQTLVTNLKTMQERGFLGRKLAVAKDQVPWASSFFPTWYGGAAGRWQDSKLKLVARSLLGMPAPDATETEGLLTKTRSGDKTAADRLSKFSPTEKYDLAAGDYQFHATMLESRLRGHNIAPIWEAPFWMGYCNGIALTALRYPEPVREVDVINPEGYLVRFHPQDIKALLGLAMASAELLHWSAGTRCESWAMSTPDCIDLNPATFVVALVNRLGIAKQSFVIDQNPLQPVVNDPIRSAEIHLLNNPYRVSGIEGVTYLVEVQIDIAAASTLLNDAAANVRADGNGFFKPVEGGEAHLVYQATLALDERFNLVGGRWIGTQMSGPDFIWGLLLDPIPQIQQVDHLVTNRFMRWSFVSALQKASVSASPQIPVIRYEDIIKPTDNQIIASFYKDATYKVRKGRPVRIFGFLDAKHAATYDHVSFFAGKTEEPRPEEAFVATYAFPRSDKQLRRLIFDVQGEVIGSEAGKGATYLRGYYYRTVNGELQRTGQSVTKIFER